MINWKRLLKAVSIVVTAAMIFCILATLIEWLVNNHPTLLMIIVIAFFVSLAIGIIYLILWAFDD